ALVARGRVVLTGELAAIKRERGGNLYRLAGSGPLAGLSAIPGVESVLPAGDGAVRLALAEGVDPSAVLREALARVDVREFRSEEPDLESIFVRTVRDAG
ncbi:MAG TPA: DUF4162 domain-containing protein, partial [Thermoanaerobaculia bacterium]|nr:DUF4162 domain-containing protein [Thermoanaerobaculia bacterium]